MPVFLPGSKWRYARGDLLVVVQDDNHVGVHKASMVHRLICHATGDRAVPDDSNAVVLPLLWAAKADCEESLEHLP